VIAYLLQSCDKRENEAPPGNSLAIGDLLHTIADGTLVQGSLFGRKRRVFVHYDFIGKIGDDGTIGFQTAKQERRGDAAQSVSDLFRFVDFDWLAVVRPEMLERMQVAGYDEIENAPEFAQVIFHGSAREGEPVGCHDFLHRLTAFGFGIFYQMRFVQDGDIPFLVLKFFLVAEKGFVGGEEDIGRFVVSSSSVIGGNAERWRELFEFALPVGDESGRSAYQGAICERFRFLEVKDAGNRLHGFSQSHVVREDTAEATFHRRGDPSEASRLIGTQRCVEARWKGNVAVGHSAVGHDIVRHDIRGSHLGLCRAIDRPREHRGELLLQRLVEFGGSSQIFL